MLTVTGLADAAYVISSVALSTDEYYAGVGESPGACCGKWAEKLGLAGMVEADQLRALVDGREPIAGEDLLGGSRPRSVKAFDLTFSCPKSVSLLWAFGDDAAAGVAAEAHREAVEVALGFLEERAAAARAQSHGLRRRVGTEGWAVAGFAHRTSREVGRPERIGNSFPPRRGKSGVKQRYVLRKVCHLAKRRGSAGTVMADVRAGWPAGSGARRNRLMGGANPIEQPKALLLAWRFLVLNPITVSRGAGRWLQSCSPRSASPSWTAKSKKSLRLSVTSGTPTGMQQAATQVSLCGLVGRVAERYPPAVPRFGRFLGRRG